jgi:hypothetical protein
MNRSGWIPVAVVLGLCGLTGSARADLVTIQFSGQVTQKTDLSGLVSPSFGAPGTSLTGVLQYDTALPPLGTGSLANDYAFTKFSMSLNGTTFPGHVSLGYDVTINVAPTFDGLHAGSLLNDPGLFPNFSGGNMAFDLSDFLLTAITSPNLPTSLNLAAFQSKTFQITLQASNPAVIVPTVDQSVAISGNIDNLSVTDTKPGAAPEPTSCLLFGIGLLGTASLVRRGRRTSGA